MLIIEDDAKRIELFKANFINIDIVFVDNVKDAINVLKNVARFDYILFDHDLGPGGDSVDVANWLIKNPNKMPNFIYVHSMNPVGAQNIVNKLPDAYKAPMIWKTKIDFNNE